MGTVLFTGSLNSSVWHFFVFFFIQNLPSWLSFHSFIFYYFFANRILRIAIPTFARSRTVYGRNLWKKEDNGLQKNIFSDNGMAMMRIYILIKLWSPWLYVCLFGCLFVCLRPCVRILDTYGMATLIYNNLLNLISGTVILLRSS